MLNFLFIVFLFSVSPPPFFFPLPQGQVRFTERKIGLSLIKQDGKFLTLALCAAGGLLKLIDQQPLRSRQSKPYSSHTLSNHNTLPGVIPEHTNTQGIESLFFSLSTANWDFLPKYGLRLQIH